MPEENSYDTVIGAERKRAPDHGGNMDSRISGHTGLLALIGSPVGHSGSPAMYNYSFERLGLDYVYVAFDIKVEEVADAIAAMRTFKMRGCNVTMP